MTKNVIIIGSGPAAHTAAIYAGRAELQPLLFEGLYAGGVAAGGQLTTTTEVENFPGFPKGISGPSLMVNMRAQSIASGARIETLTIDRVDFSSKPFKVFAGEESYAAHTVIIATGATAKRLFLPEEEQFWQKGVSACAVCDGPLPIFRDVPLFVIGGGDSACEEAMFLTKYGKSVTLVHRRGSLRASAVMQKRVLNHPKIKILWHHTLVGMGGDKRLEEVSLKNVESGAVTKHEAGGLFYAIGHTPNTDFLGGAVESAEDGYLIIHHGSTGTSVDGIFAAGDVHDKKYRQAITAAGSGCMAFFEAQSYLERMDSASGDADATSH